MQQDLASIDAGILFNLTGEVVFTSRAQFCLVTSTCLTSVQPIPCNLVIDFMIGLPLP